MIWWFMTLAWWAAVLEPAKQRHSAEVIDFRQWKAEHPHGGHAA